MSRRVTLAGSIGLRDDIDNLTLGRIDDHDRFIRGLGEFEIAQQPQ